MFYKAIEEFSSIVKSFNVYEFKRYSYAISFIAKVEFTNGSILHIKDYLFLDGKRKYSYHWQDVNGNLLSRWDNSPHHKKVSTFPHHKHLPNEISVSKERSIRDIFKVINAVILESKNE